MSNEAGAKILLDFSDVEEKSNKNDIHRQGCVA